MKNLCFFVFLIVSMANFNTASAQKANSYADEDWQISYYGATTTVPAGQLGVTINVGTDCNAGIAIRSLDDPSCAYEFSGPETWTSPCTSLTGDVIFDAGVLNDFSCPNAVRYTLPEFLFKRP